jgi:cysteine desulfuration protein SufE
MSMPERLETVVERFRRAPRDLRVQALLQYARKVPPLPPHLEGGEGLERVHECQTPFFLAAEVDDDGLVRVHFDCPPDSPTVRGFAGILHTGLDGLPPAEVLAVPGDFYARMGLDEVVSPLRLRGMGAILARLKGQVRDAQDTHAGAVEQSGGLES